jgi:hydrogenase nickel incorporation protein HypB
MEIKVLKNVLDKNNNIAKKNRELLRMTNTAMINMMSSPGAGKTTILEKTIPLLQEKYSIGVIEGDAYTSKDALRLKKFNIPVIQINTEGACHLDSNSIYEACKELDLEELDIIFVENVGNLICPAAFDLGETIRVAILSTAEGEDKPSKYPMVLRDSKVVILNKTDLLPHLVFNKKEFINDILAVNPHINLFEMSANLDSGITEWVDWLMQWRLHVGERSFLG